MNGLDLFITICLGAGLIKGLFDGIVKQVVSLLSLILAIFFAGRVAGFIRELIFSQPSFSEAFPAYVWTGICYVLAFTSIIIGFYWLGKLAHKAINLTPAKGLNHFLGALLGSFTCIIFLSLVFNLLAVFDPNSHLIDKQLKEKSVLYYGTQGTIPFVYPYVKEYLYPQSDNFPFRDKEEVPSEEQKQDSI